MPAGKSTESLRAGVRGNTCCSGISLTVPVIRLCSRSTSKSQICSTVRSFDSGTVGSRPCGDDFHPAGDYFGEDESLPELPNWDQHCALASARKTSHFGNETPLALSHEVCGQSSVIGHCCRENQLRTAVRRATLSLLSPLTPQTVVRNFRAGSRENCCRDEGLHLAWRLLTYISPQRNSLSSGGCSDYGRRDGGVNYTQREYGLCARQAEATCRQPPALTWRRKQLRQRILGLAMASDSEKPSR